MGLRSGRRARSANEGAKDRYERATVLLAAALRRRGVLFPLPTPAAGQALPPPAHGQGRRAPPAGAAGGLRAPQPLAGGGTADREPSRVRAGRQGAARGVLQVRGVQDISPRNFKEPPQAEVRRISLLGTWVKKIGRASCRKE